MTRCTIKVNGEPLELPSPVFVDAVVAAIVDSASGIAVAIDRVVVPRSLWATTQVAAGSSVEIVTAAAGG